MNTWRFIAERFPLKATLPMVAILAFGPMSSVSFTILDGAMVFATLFLSLLSIRMADDLTSMDVDRITHPDRGLPSGRISATRLTHAMITMATIVVVLNGLGGCLGGTLLLAGYYGLHFRIRKSIPVLIKPFFSNFVFCWIPLYIACTLLDRFSSAHLILGLFAYGSAVGHEFAHNVHALDESPGHSKTYASLLGPRRSAVLSLLIYVAAGAMGFLYWSQADRPDIFFLLLVATSAQIVYLEIRLIRDPAARTAKPFYVAGFGFFLFPYLGLILDNIGRIGMLLW